MDQGKKWNFSWLWKGCPSLKDKTIRLHIRGCKIHEDVIQACLGVVDSMNQQSKRPLIETATGGKGGGGARLTDSGEKAIETFWNLYKRFKSFLKNETMNFKV